MKLELVNKYPFLLNQILNYIDGNVFNTKQAYPVLDFKFVFEDCIADEVLDIYINNEKVYTVSCPSTPLDNSGIIKFYYEIGVSKDDILNNSGVLLNLLNNGVSNLIIKGVGSISGETNQIIINLENYLSFIWVYAQYLGQLLDYLDDYRFALSLSDNNLLSFYNEDKLNLLRDFIRKEVIPLIGSFNDQDLINAFKVQRRSRLNNSNLIALWVLKELFYPFIEDVIWIGFGDWAPAVIGDYNIQKIDGNNNSNDNSNDNIYLNQRIYRFKNKWFNGTDPEVLDASGFNKPVVIADWSNIYKHNGSKLSVKLVEPCELINEFGFKPVTGNVKVYKKNGLNFALVNSLFYSELFNLGNIDGMLPLSSNLIEIGDASDIDNITLEEYFAYKQAVILATFTRDDNNQLTLKWEPSFLDYSMVFNKGGRDDGILFLYFKSNITTEIKKRILQIAKHYWSLIRPVFKVLALGWGCQDNVDCYFIENYSFGEIPEAPQPSFAGIYMIGNIKQSISQDKIFMVGDVAPTLNQDKIFMIGTVKQPISQDKIFTIGTIKQNINQDKIFMVGDENIGQ